MAASFHSLPDLYDHAAEIVLCAYILRAKPVHEQLFRDIRE